MDRFDAMQAFARVVEAGSFTRAAETLHMSKTSVTQLVQQLEARLRVKLLNRTTRQVKVTADGAAYYERVLRVLADVDDAETSLSGASAAPRGRLRVDVPSPLARMILVPALPAFHARYPEIQLDMGVSDRMVDVIADNVDCVVRGGELTDQSLVARKVGDLQLGVYAALDYLASAGMPSHPRELEDTHHRIVGFLWARTGKPFPYAMHKGGESLKVQGRHLFAFDDGNAYLAAGLAGLGILWLPGYMAREHVLLAPYQGRKPPARLASVQQAASSATALAPGMKMAFIAFPGTAFSSPHHYTVFLRGNEPFNSRLLKPVLVDAGTNALTASPPLPWYLTALLVSQPLHFGDYGGMPMQILWALLDIATIIVLGSGLYLWLKRRNPAVAAKPAMSAAAQESHGLPRKAPGGAA